MAFPQRPPYEETVEFVRPKAGARAGARRDPDEAPVSRRRARVEDVHVPFAADDVYAISRRIVEEVVAVPDARNDG